MSWVQLGLFGAVSGGFFGRESLGAFDSWAFLFQVLDFLGGFSIFCAHDSNQGQSARPRSNTTASATA